MRNANNHASFRARLGGQCWTKAQNAGAPRSHSRTPHSPGEDSAAGGRRDVPRPPGEPEGEAPRALALAPTHTQPRGSPLPPPRSAGLSGETCAVSGSDEEGLIVKGKETENKRRDKDRCINLCKWLPAKEKDSPL